MREELPIFERGRLVADVPLRSSGAPMTFYVRYGDVFALACWGIAGASRSEEHTSELQSRTNLVCRLLLEKKKKVKK